MSVNPWSGLVVVCATTFWSGTRLLDQHIAERLSAFAPVLYVDPPTSFLSRFRNPQAASHRRPAGLHRLTDRIALLSPRVPPLKERPGGKQVALAAVRHQMRTAVRRLGAPAVQAVIVPSLNPLFGALDENVKVFYAKDDYVAGAELMSVGRRRLVRRARRQPRDADVVVVVSPTLAASVEKLGISPVLVPNGADVEHFTTTPPPPVAPVGERVVAFVGHLSDRVDVELLLELAARGVRLKLVGPRQPTLTTGRFDTLLGLPHVEWLGPVPYAELPRVLGDATTCVLPYGDSDFNRASFPLKLLEYLAAGRRVVSTDLPAVRWLATPLVATAAGPGPFADAVVTSLAVPLEQPEIDARRDFAARHGWEERGRTLAAAIGLSVPDRRSVS